MTDKITNVDFHPLAKGAELRRTLSGVPGLQLHGSHEAKLSAGKFEVEMWMDAGNDLRIECGLCKPIELKQALRRNTALPGNLRFAITSGGMRLLAELQLGVPARLGELIQEVQAGIGLAADGPPQQDKQQPDNETVDVDQLKDAVREIEWDDQSIVELAEEWELRPRCAGADVPVRLSCDGARVRCRRIICMTANGDLNDAVAAQALRFNALLKHARLSSTETGIAAEVCLPHSALDGHSLANAARAVALADARARTVLQVLIQEEVVAKAYAEMFLEGPREQE